MVNVIKINVPILAYRNMKNNKNGNVENKSMYIIFKNLLAKNKFMELLVACFSSV